MKRWGFPLLLLAVTCFGVFVLPFLFPPHPLQGLSAANVAGFNNKVASIAAALIGISVFALSLRSRQSSPIDPASGDYRPVSRRLVLTTTAVCAAVIAIVSVLIIQTKFRYLYDAYYFVNQISMHADYGRKLYDQIEFPYGPLIFYGPIAVRALLSPLHLSGEGAYFTTLVIEYAIGLFLIAFLVDGLPMLRKWKALFFVLCAIYGVQPNLGINYTYIRFIVPAVCLLIASRMTRPWVLAAVLFFGQILCLAISPEMGFGFLASACAYALWQVATGGASWSPALFAPIVATPVFLLIMGAGYFRMLGLFAHGYLNLVIEPLPHILVFLYALVWLVPPVIALFFRQRLPQAPLLASLYILSLALLPAALGDADPGHVFFNGVGLYALAMVAASQRSRRYQTAWAACFTFVVLWSVVVNLRFLRGEYQTVIRKQLIGDSAGPVGKATASLLGRVSPSFLRHGYDSEREDSLSYVPLDLAKLQQIVGNAPVATPYNITLPIEETLHRSGQYVPSFYCFFVAVIDRDAELRKIEEFNTAQWALLPYGVSLRDTLTPDSTETVLGFGLPYRQKNAPYVIGSLFEQNLATHWQSWARIGLYEVYKRR